MSDASICSRRQALKSLAIGLPAGLSLGTMTSSVATRTATVIYVRHAEKEQGEGAPKDPSLTAEGVQRATKLASILQATEVTRVFATEFKRTQETARHVADAMDLEVEEYAAGESLGHANALGGLDSGTVAVVVGHSNTVPMMVKALGGELQGLDRRGQMAETEYDRVIIQILFAAEGSDPMRALQTLDLRIEL